MKTRYIPGVSLHWPAENRAQILASPGQRIVDRWRAAHKAQGWRDIGYHYVVHRDQAGQWHVYPGRPDSLPGAHSGTNAGNKYLGINVAYGMDEGLPAEAFQRLARLIAELSDKYGFPINRHTVKGHREFLPTSCPGNPLFNRLDELVRTATALKKGCKLPEQPPADQEEEQIVPVKVVFKGKPLDGVLINSQAFVSVYELGKPEWNPQTRTVTLK
ncbi:MAG: peptidoglycan recognition family protein [Anaerolineales bacterium]